MNEEDRYTRQEVRRLLKVHFNTGLPPEERLDMRAGLNRLPTRYRKACRMLGQGYSHPEIARQLCRSKTPDAGYSLVKRAVQRLAALMNSEAAAARQSQDGACSLLGLRPGSLTE